MGLVRGSLHTVLPLIAVFALTITVGCRSEYEKHLDLGKQLRSEERYAEAIRELELATKANPKAAKPYEYIAKIYKHQLRYDIAAQYYRKAMEVDPEFIDGYAQLVKMLRLAGNLNEASKVAKDAMQKTEIKRDMKATREIQEQMDEIEKTRKALRAAPPPPPPPAPTPAKPVTVVPTPTTPATTMPVRATPPAVAPTSGGLAIAPATRTPAPAAPTPAQKRPGVSGPVIPPIERTPGGPSTAPRAILPPAVQP